VLACLPERHDLANLLLGLGLAAHVSDAYAEVGVTRFQVDHLPNAVERHRPHEDQEVEEEVEGKDHGHGAVLT
jgi:hypothetical protein